MYVCKPLCYVCACFGCCIDTRPESILVSKHGVADLTGKRMRNADAWSRTRVTSMGGLYDTATLHALLLHLRWCSNNRVCGFRNS